MYIEDDNFLDDGQKRFIDNIVLTDKFPFYYNSSAITGDTLGFLVHNVLLRPEIRKDGENGINSEAFDLFEDMLNAFTSKNGLEYKEIFRISVNMTMNIGVEKSHTHKDHDFPHKQLLIYLNDFKGGETVILNDDDTIFKKTKPKKFLGVCFDDKKHYGVLPKVGRRLVAVYTFR